MAAALALTLALGVAVLAVNYSRTRATEALDHPPNALTDARAADEVIGAVLEIVKAAGVLDPAGGYAFTSCKNADEQPYRATVHVTFTVPQGNSVAYLGGVQAAMMGLGWTNANTRAEHFGWKLTRSGLTAEFYRNPERTDLATMRVSGECRVVSDHRADDPAWTELTDRLRQPG